MTSKVSLTRSAICLCLISVLQPALAQSTGTPPSNASGTPPPQQLAITPSGVDMRTQRYAYSKTDIEIGPLVPDTHMDLVRSTLTNSAGEGAFGNFDSDFAVRMVEKRINISGRHFEHGTGNDYRVTIVIGGISDTFQMIASNSGFTNIGANKESTLEIVGNIAEGTSYYKYISGAGTEYVFRRNDSKDCSSVMRCSYVSDTTYPEGVRLDFSYTNPSGTIGRAAISRVKSNVGYDLVFEHGLAGRNVTTKACLINTATTYVATPSCPGDAIRTVHYTYGTTPSGRMVLTAVEGATGKSEGFSYTETEAGLAYPVEMSYFSGTDAVAYLINDVQLYPNDDPADGGREAITRQRFADGSVVDFEYRNSSDYTADSVKSVAGGSYTTAQGTTIVEYGLIMLPRSMWMTRSVDNPTHENVGDAPYQLTEGPVRVVDPLGRETRFNYCDPVLEAMLPATDTTHRCVVGNLHSMTDPAGLVVKFTYDGAGRVVQSKRIAKPQSGLSDITTITTYAGPNRKTAGKPLTVTDALGNKTINSYDPQHGGLTKTVAPAVDGISAARRFLYQQRSAWVKNASGGYSPQSPIWVMVEERSCRTTATSGDTCTGGSADEVVTTYDYGPDTGPSNLMLRGSAVSADGVTRWTCYGGDAAGNRISETKPRAGLTACP